MSDSRYHDHDEEEEDGQRVVVELVELDADREELPEDEDNGSSFGSQMDPLVPQRPLHMNGSSTSPCSTSTTTRSSRIQTSRHCNRTEVKTYTLLVLLFGTVAVGTFLWLINRNNDDYRHIHWRDDSSISFDGGQMTTTKTKTTTVIVTNSSNEISYGIELPTPLLDRGVYNPGKDFVNEIGISPPYWTLVQDNRTITWPNSYILNNANEKVPTVTWGPCFPDPSIRDWTTLVSTSTGYQQQQQQQQQQPDGSPTTLTSTPIKYEFLHDPNDNNWNGPSSHDGTCRPGFIIIGAGKCGTSSLYHYLLGHPRVAPAYSKQIHYFIYHLNKRMEWYYSWFPKAESFLQHGALITGEASPGYLPYPRAVRSAFERLQGRPKFIAIGRNPLTRMYSSYRYNYCTPALQMLRNGQVPGVRRGQTDQFYEENLFSFEDFIRTELQLLKNCLGEPGGFGAQKTRSKWYPEKWTKAEFNRRKEQGLHPLIDLDEVCYGHQVNRTVLRPQWADMQMAHPEKFIPPRNAFLIQAIIGRSLYLFPLEWWYILFDASDILFYCTEDLSNPTKLNDLSMQLGLPSFDYTSIVNQGAFNVGTNQGYDQATPWDELESDPLLTGPDSFRTQPTTGPMSSLSSSLHDTESSSGTEPPPNDEGLEGDDDPIPLSAELRKELLEFIQPFNDRLFQLTGKQCDWYLP